MSAFTATLLFCLVVAQTQACTSRGEQLVMLSRKVLSAEAEPPQQRHFIKFEDSSARYRPSYKEFNCIEEFMTTDFLKAANRSNVQQDDQAAELTVSSISGSITSSSVSTVSAGDVQQSIPTAEDTVSAAGKRRAKSNYKKSPNIPIAVDAVSAVGGNLAKEKGRTLDEITSVIGGDELSVGKLVSFILVDTLHFLPRLINLCCYENPMLSQPRSQLVH